MPARLPYQTPRRARETGSSLFCIAEDAVHLLQRLELLHRAGVPRVFVGVQRQSQLAECLADLLLRPTQ